MVIPFLITYSNILTNEYMYVCTYVGTWGRMSPSPDKGVLGEGSYTGRLWRSLFGNLTSMTGGTYCLSNSLSRINGLRWCLTHKILPSESEIRLSFTNSLFILGACSHVHAQGIAPPWGFNWLQKSVETARSRDCTNNHSICMFHT